MHSTAVRCAKVEQTFADFRARREATLWQRLNRVLRILLGIAVWLVIISLFVPPYKKLTHSRAEIDNLLAQVNDQKTLLARQTREINLLKTDPTYRAPDDVGAFIGFEFYAENLTLSFLPEAISYADVSLPEQFW